jgi:hypothetical protein
MKNSRIFWEKDIALLPIFNFSSKGRTNQNDIQINWGTNILLLKNESFGLPGAFDFRVYSELMRRASKNRKNGEFQRRISFKLSEFAKSMKMQPGGRQLNAVDESFQRLHNTHCIFECDEKTKRRRERFVLLDRITDRRSIREWGEEYWVELSSFVIGHLNQNLWLYVPEELWNNIDSDIAKALLLKLIPQILKTNKEKKFSRSYQDLCTRLRLTTYSAPSKAKEKLGPTLDNLIKANAIKNWNIRKGSAGLVIDISHNGIKESEKQQKQKFNAPSMKNSSNIPSKTNEKKDDLNINDHSDYLQNNDQKTLYDIFEEKLKET